MFSYSTCIFVGTLQKRLVEKKTRMVDLPGGEKFENMFTFSTQYTNVTDGQTPHDGMHSVARRGALANCNSHSNRLAVKI